ncbi:trans-sulfuration enzyme family protein [Halomonas sp. V046]|uniref:trans-sulfuration enzyme family protein n=1 Tax=Halomonas sp. V046 TaxID=3459611 RepID=UPI004044088D
MSASDHHGMSTRAIHAERASDPHGCPHVPIYDTTTFVFPTTQALTDVSEGRRRGGLYTRYGMNPTLFALEDSLASLEHAPAALSFGSGMAAISALLLAHGRQGVVCLGEVYGGTLGFLTEQLPELGYATYRLLGDETERLEALLEEGVGLVYIETPSNPTLALTDIARLAELAHRHGALLAVDNTFATPINQQPLALGADIVVHSATKYLGGHSDLTAGAMMGPEALLAKVVPWRTNLGTAPSPQVASMLSRSLRTLAVRVAQHNASALAIAEAMHDHPRVRRVCYPGLPSHPGHALARAQMRGFGGMLTLDLDADGAGAARVAERLTLFLLAPSLGGVESLVTQPITTTHVDLSPDERARRGIGDGMLRLSVGLEDVDDLIADLRQALAE